MDLLVGLLPVLAWQGEKLLSKLGGLFSLGYKPKKGKAVTGPKDYGGQWPLKEDSFIGH